MASSANTIWQLRTTGSDSNGGGFVKGATGTDYTQQDAAQWALTGVTSSGSGNTVLSSAAEASMVGNIAQAISGTNINAGFYQITSVSVGVSITFATNKSGQSICSGAAASGVINIGGALLTPAKVMTGQQVGNMCRVDPGTYAITTAVSDNRAAPAAVYSQRNYWYGTSPTNRPIFRIGANSISLFTITGGGTLFENIEFDGNSANYPTDTSGISWSSGASVVWRNCVFHNFTSYAAFCAGYGLFLNCDFYSCSGTLGVLAINGSQFVECRFYNNSGTAAFQVIAVNSGSVQLIDSLIFNNTVGTAAYRLFDTGVMGIVRGNTFYNNNGTVRLTAFHGLVRDNIFESFTSAKPISGFTTMPAMAYWDGNWYYNNAAGNRFQVDDTSGIYAGYSYVNSLDVASLTSALNNPGGGDFSLAAGALARNIGRPLPGGAVSYKDFGALQAIAAGLMPNLSEIGI